MRLFCQNLEKGKSGDERRTKGGRGRGRGGGEGGKRKKKWRKGNGGVRTEIRTKNRRVMLYRTKKQDAISPIDKSSLEWFLHW